MSRAEPSFVVLLSLLGPAADAYVLAELNRDGFTGLRVSHGYVVQRLLERPRSISDLAIELGITQQAVSKSVAQLGAAGYAELSTDPADGRRRLVSLTERGRASVARARTARSDLTERLTRRVGQAELEVARRVANELAAELGLADAMARRQVSPPIEP